MLGYDLLVVGSANADLVIGVDRRPGAGETVLGSDLAVHPGGKGANQAVAAARLGARTALLARVGGDAYGRLLLDAQRAAGVDTVGVLVGEEPTGVAVITVDAAGDNSIVVSPGANARLEPGDIRAAGSLLASARVVSAQLEIPMAAVAEAVRSRAPGARLVLNASPPAQLPPQVLAACDPLVVNEHEALALLAGHPAAEADEPAAWASALLSRGPRSVVITLGAAGALAADRNGVVTVPAPRVAVVDTTGAGDAFTGALAWRLSAGDGLETAVRYAVRVGSAACARAGAQSSFPRAGDPAVLPDVLPPGES
ncbi:MULTISPECIES: ribokinase [Streptomyces]|uniref:ribokinase n=1 Tax=Streptomyces TaxID=1883 RepID=UPI001D1405CB|nr:MULTISPECIES: ribokinase [Streptomyces]MCC3653915.1 ribokinase [Streptomyces sp. S07_1.15]WSQ71570.1 ribokinase [Streptomyces xinghaiensis]